MKRKELRRASKYLHETVEQLEKDFLMVVADGEREFPSSNILL